MQTMPVIVTGKLYLLALHCYFAIFDSIGIASYRGSEICRVIPVILYGIKPEYNIPQRSMLIGHHYRNNTPAEISQAYFHPVFIGKGI